MMTIILPSRETPQRLTLEQAIVITGFTGVLCCEFADLHTDVERRTNREIPAHEFYGEAGLSMTREIYRADFLALIPTGTRING